MRTRFKFLRGKKKKGQIIQKCAFFRWQKYPGFQTNTWPKARQIKTWWDLTKTVLRPTTASCPAAAQVDEDERPVVLGVSKWQVTLQNPPQYLPVSGTDIIPLCKAGNQRSAAFSK